MKKSRYTEEQIIGILKQHQAGLGAKELPEARRIIEEWRIDYNTLRPHTSLDGLTPTEFAARPIQGHNQNRLSP